MARSLYERLVDIHKNRSEHELSLMVPRVLRRPRADQRYKARVVQPSANEIDPPARNEHVDVLHWTQGSGRVQPIREVGAFNERERLIVEDTAEGNDGLVEKKRTDRKPSFQVSHPFAGTLGDLRQLRFREQ